MIEILTLFMWMATGPQRVDLSVTGPVVQVEIHLDGERIGELKQPPWSFQYDFGTQLQPRELRVIARDARGRELDRAVRWINLGVSTAEAQIDFETDAAGHPRVARLDWESVGVTRFEAIEFTFDGERIPVGDPSRVVLPPYDESEMHFVGVILRFPGQKEIELSTSFGGRYGAEVTTELTAIPLKLGKGARLPEVRQLGNWLTQLGAGVIVHAVEKGEAEVVVVRDPAVQPHFDAMFLAQSRAPARSRDVPQQSRRDVIRRLRQALAFPQGTHTRFISPSVMPLHHQGVTDEIFPSSEILSAKNEGLLWLSHKNRPRRLPVQLADAVALSGMEVQASGRRRAVILILGGTVDRSQYSVANVREYLRQLRVPLHVWSIGSVQPDPEWGEVRDIGDANNKLGSVNRLRAAVREVSRDLAAQRVVWIRGRLLPQTVELSGQASKVTLAGAS